MRYSFCVLLLVWLSMIPVAGQTQISFTLADPPPGEAEVVGIRGSLPPLSWDATFPLEKEGGKYVVTLPFAQTSQTLEFKFVAHATEGGEVIWEGIDNRLITLSAGSLQHVGSWDEPPYIDPKTLPKLSVEALQADYVLIEQVLRNAHPGTYRYLTEDELTANLMQLKQQFSQPLSISEAYLALNELLASIRCGHTASPLYNQGQEVTSMLHYGKDKLPFTFRWKEGKMVVLQDATAGSILPRGTEVVSLNGVAVADILKTLRKYVGSDGPAVAPVDEILSLRGYPWRLEAFDALYHLAFPIPDDGVSIVYRPVGQAVATTKIEPLRRKERAAVIAQRFPNYPQRADDLWHLEIGANNVAVLTVGDFTGFGLGRLELDFEAFFANAFAQIENAGVKQLIIDVRENEGGNDPIVLELFSYLDFKPSKGSPFEGRMRYQSFPADLRPFVKTWGQNIPSFFEPKSGKRGEGGYFLYPKAFTGERGLKTKKNAFSGEVIFLTSPLNASLGFYLANNARLNQVGTLIGQTTGGSLRGISGGNLAMLRLPETNLELDFPVVGGFAREDVPATGVVPDVVVIPTLADLQQGRDVVLEAAYAYFKRSN